MHTSTAWWNGATKFLFWYRRQKVSEGTLWHCGSRPQPLWVYPDTLTRHFFLSFVHVRNSQFPHKWVFGMSVRMSSSLLPSTMHYAYVAEYSSIVVHVLNWLRWNSRRWHPQIISYTYLGGLDFRNATPCEWWLYCSHLEENIENREQDSLETISKQRGKQ